MRRIVDRPPSINRPEARPCQGWFGVPLASCDAVKLSQHSDVDLITTGRGQSLKASITSPRLREREHSAALAPPLVESRSRAPRILFANRQAAILARRWYPSPCKCVAKKVGVRAGAPGITTSKPRYGESWLELQ